MENHGHTNVDFRGSGDIGGKGDRVCEFVPERVGGEVEEDVVDGGGAGGDSDVGTPGK